ncbi:MAG: hypothetical protein L0I79_05705, partial [Atopostipes sp.]|nr:hypothetical protein [Atopostipes sp.]
EKQPKYTNEQNDLLSDDKEVYIRNQGKYEKITGNVEKVNNKEPDDSGNVEIDTGAMTVNDEKPDDSGNVEIDTGVMQVNGKDPDEQGNIDVDSGVKTVTNVAPDENGNVNLELKDFTEQEKLVRKNQLEEFNETITTQLEQSVKQVDFVKLLQDHNVTSDFIYARKNGDRNVDVFVPFKNKKGVCYNFSLSLPNVTTEGYILFQSGYVGELAPVLHKRNYDSKTGEWRPVTSANTYTTEVGATLTIPFYGVGLDFQVFKDDRGGIWELVIDGDTANKVTVSTYSETRIQTVTVPIARDLESGEHVCVATFKGDDPLNPPSTSPSRGWIKYDESTEGVRQTFFVYDDREVSVSKKFDVLMGGSNKEYAIKLKPKNSALDYQFIPTHEEIPSVFKQEQKIYIDSDIVTDWTAETGYKKVKSVQIVQKMIGKHAGDPNNPMAEIFSIHTVTSKGVSLKVKIKFLRDLLSVSGYGLMLPVYSSFARNLITSTGNLYDASITDGSSTDITDGENSISFAFVNTDGTNGEQDTVLAMTVQNPYKTFRMDKSDKRNPLVWLQHRSSYMQKLYTQTFKSATITSGDTYEIGATYYIGELPMASDILTV